MIRWIDRSPQPGSSPGTILSLLLQEPLDREYRPHGRDGIGPATKQISARGQRDSRIILSQGRDCVLLHRLSPNVHSSSLSSWPTLLGVEVEWSYASAGVSPSD